MYVVLYLLFGPVILLFLCASQLFPQYLVNNCTTFLLKCNCRASNYYNKNCLCVAGTMYVKGCWMLVVWAPDHRSVMFPREHVQK